MDLRTGCPYWMEKNGELGTYGQLEHDVNCEVAIIGAGITGAFCAYFLAEAGIDVVVLDRRQPGRGSTAASTGLLQYEIDSSLTKLIELIGEEHAVRAYRLCYGSFAKMEELVGALGDRCGYALRKSLYLASTPQDAEALPKEHALRRAAGIDVDLLSEADIRARFSFSRPGALLSHLAAEIDPYRLTHRMLEWSRQRGVSIYAHTEVAQYISDENGVTLVTAQGRRIRARHAVFATGYETPEFLDQEIIELKSTYALAAEPTQVPCWWENCLIWETARPYFYARCEASGRVLIGGEDEDIVDAAQRDALLADKARTLEQKFERMFNHPIHAVCTWAGTFGQTKDGLPYIGPNRQFPRGYFALGYGGNGITFGLLAAEIIRDQIVGKFNPDAAIFRFDR